MTRDERREYMRRWRERNRGREGEYQREVSRRLQAAKVGRREKWAAIAARAAKVPSQPGDAE